MEVEMVRIQIEKGSFRLPWPRGARVDFAIFPKVFEDDDPEAKVDYLQVENLPDGSPVYICPWGTVISQNCPTPSTWDPGIELPQNKVIRPASRSRRSEVRALLQHACAVCHRPSVYEIRWVESMSPRFQSKAIFETKHTCLRCLNESLIDLMVRGTRHWVVYQRSSPYLLCDRFQRYCGTVVYSAKLRKLIPPPVIPDLPIKAPTGHRISLPGDPTATLTVVNKGSCLYVHHDGLYERLQSVFGWQLNDNGVKVSEIKDYLGISTASFGVDLRIRSIIYAPLSADGETQEEASP